MNVGKISRVPTGEFLAIISVGNGIRISKFLVFFCPFGFFGLLLCSNEQLVLQQDFPYFGTLHFLCRRKYLYPCLCSVQSTTNIRKEAGFTHPYISVILKRVLVFKTVNTRGYFNPPQWLLFFSLLSRMYVPGGKTTVCGKGALFSTTYPASSTVT